MKAKLLSTLAVGACLAMVSSAWASEPVALNEKQMDTVTAGGLVLGQAFADAGANAGAWGVFNSNTATSSKVNTMVIGTIVLQIADPSLPDPTATFVYVQAASHSNSQAASQ